MSASLVVPWDDALVAYDFGPDHPLNPLRVDLTMRLARALGVLDLPQVTLTRPDEATDDLLALVRVHGSGSTPLFTVEEARGKGVGRALINAVYEHAKSAGSQRVYWQTHETNAVAIRLYDQIAEKSGFVVYRKAL